MIDRGTRQDNWQDRVEELLRVIAKKRRRHEHQWHLATWFVRHPTNMGVAYWVCPCGAFKETESIVAGREPKEKR